MLPISQQLGRGAFAAFTRSTRAFQHALRGAAPATRQGSISTAATTGTRTAGFQSTSSIQSPPRVVIVGGGFGGLYAAIRLTQLFWPKGKTPQVTLVDKAERFTFKPLLYELVNNTATDEEVGPYFSQLLASYPVQFVQAKVLSVEPEANNPSTSNGSGTNASSSGYSNSVSNGSAYGGSSSSSSTGGLDSMGGFTSTSGFASTGGYSSGTASPSSSTGGAGGGTDGFSVSARAGRVQLENGASLDYDWLVVALGSSPDTRGIPGVQELALPFNVYDDAVRVKAALASIEYASKPSSLITVVGAGYAGVELATVIAERMRGKADVRLITPGPDILEPASAGQRATAHKVLASHGVSIMRDTKVLRLKESAMSGPAVPTSCVAELELADGTFDALPVDLVLWTAGASPVTKDAKQRSGLPFPMTDKGAILTESTLRVQNHEQVFALGDISGPEYGQEGRAAAAGGSEPAMFLPATAQVAFQEADYVAWNLWASINGRTLLPFRYQHLGTLMSLGQLNAALALPFSLPRPLESIVNGSPLEPLLNVAGIKLNGGAGGQTGSGVTLDGPLAAVLRRMAYLYRQPTTEQRLNVATSWVQQAVSAVTGSAGNRS